MVNNGHIRHTSTHPISLLHTDYHPPSHRDVSLLAVQTHVFPEKKKERVLEKNGPQWKGKPPKHKILKMQLHILHMDLFAQQRLNDEENTSKKSKSKIKSGTNK